MRVMVAREKSGDRRREPRPIKLSVGAKRHLRLVRDHVLAEPKRINMAWFLVKGKHELLATNPPSKIPACNTVGCVAGFICHLAGSPTSVDYIWESYRVLGLRRDTNAVSPSLYRLFYVSDWPEKFRKRIARHEPQTPGYARAVAARIDYFIETGW